MKYNGVKLFADAYYINQVKFHSSFVEYCKLYKCIYKICEKNKIKKSLPCNCFTKRFYETLYEIIEAYIGKQLPSLDPSESINSKLFKPCVFNSILNIPKTYIQTNCTLDAASFMMLSGINESGQIPDMKKVKKAEILAACIIKYYIEIKGSCGITNVVESQLKDIGKCITALLDENFSFFNGSDVISKEIRNTICYDGKSTDRSVEDISNEIENIKKRLGKNNIDKQLECDAILIFNKVIADRNFHCHTDLHKQYIRPRRINGSSF